MTSRPPRAFRVVMYPPMWVAAIAVAMWMSGRVAPSIEVPGDDIRVAVGIVGIVIGIGIALVAERQLANRGTTVIPGRAPSALVTSGLFSRSRNPIYAGFELALIGWFLILGESAGALGILVFPALIYWRIIAREERVLAERFGDEWLAYSRRVRRWM